MAASTHPAFEAGSGKGSCPCQGAEGLEQVLRLWLMQIAQEQEGAAASLQLGSWAQGWGQRGLFSSRGKK